MENYETLLATLTLTLGASWASGINLYAVLLVLGIGGSTGNIDLPPDLEILQDPMVIGAAGLMYFIEFFVDKTPGVDTGWDGLHTFVRIPAGAMLAAGAVGDVSPVLEVTAGILGGGVAATSHAAKAGSRMLINTSPEPVTNWTASITEDLMVFGGLWAALNHPVLFLVLFIAFIALTIWLLPKIYRLLKTVFRKIGNFFSGRADTESNDQNLPQETKLNSPSPGESTSSEPKLSVSELVALNESGELSDGDLAKALRAQESTGEHRQK